MTIIRQMQNPFVGLVIFAVGLMWGWPVQSFSQWSNVFNKEEFASRRAALLQLMPDSSAAIFNAARSKTRSNDIAYEYRQDSNYYYLTGISSPQGILVLTKIDEKSTSQNTATLFVPRPNPRAAAWIGRTLSPQKAQDEFGFEHVQTLNAFQNSLDSLLFGKKLLYCTFKPEFIYEPVSNQRFFIGNLAKKSLKQKRPGLKVKSPQKLIASLRQIKSETELALLQKAIDITCAALLEAICFAKPGNYEYQLEAVIEYVFRHEGAEYSAFPTIVGSGPNALILHHWKNDRKIEKGDLVVLDIGAEYRGYAADVTRTIPISGKFSKAQRQIYEIVLEAQKQAIQIIKPGIPFKDVHAAAVKVIADAGYRKYFKHATSHYLGLDAHDLGDMKTLQPGMVLTVEPGIYISEGAEVDPTYWNIGIRIEDDVLVTENGYKVLSEKAPKEIHAIEKAMKRKSKLHLSFK